MSKPLDKTGLYPPFREIIEKMEEDIKTINAYLFDGFRSFEEQTFLYSKGRKFENGKWIVTDKTKIVTKAIPGMSSHNYGVGVDFVFDVNPQKQGIQWSWEDKLPWKELGTLGKDHGLEWAGDWSSFKEFPHFQNLYGFKMHQLYDTITTAKTPSQGLIEVWHLFDFKLLQIK